MSIISNLIQYIFEGSQTIYNFLTIDLGNYLGVIGDILGKLGIDLNGLTLLGLLGGIGLFALIIYSIVK